MKKLLSIFLLAVPLFAATLTWTDNSNNELGFHIERAPVTGTSTGTFTQIGIVGENVTTFVDNNTESGKQYSYRVRAYNAAGNSAYSNTANWTEPTALQVPANFAFGGIKLADVGQTQIWSATFTWTDNNADETSYRLEYKKQSESDTAWKQAATVPANAQIAPTPNLSDMTTAYSFRLRAVRGTELGPVTATINTSPANSYRASTPTNLKTSK